MRRFAGFLCFCLTVGSFLFGGGPVGHAQEEAKSLSFLFLGIDTGALGRTDQGRSDSIMVMVLQPQSQEAQLISLPRDTYVTIPGREGMDKLNHAYAYGGVDLAKQTVEAMLDTHLDHYLVLDMKGLEGLVELVGGIEVRALESFSIAGYAFVEGQDYLLNGQETLYYVRDRFSSGGDYARQARQRQVVEALVAKLQDRVFNLNPLALAQLLEYLTSDLSLNQWMHLYQTYGGRTYRVSFSQLEGQSQVIDGLYYEVPETNSLLKIQAILRGDREE